MGAVEIDDEEGVVRELVHDPRRAELTGALSPPPERHHVQAPTIINPHVGRA
jgi:hypothetical protein